MGRLLAAVLAVLALAGAGSARFELERRAAANPTSRELLYLPNGEYLKVVSLGHAGLVADALYLWAIQYYSDYTRADRYRYVEHVFGDVIAELDPQFVDAYWLGALILIAEAQDLEAGLRLLDRGFRNNPEQWVLPYLAAFECYRVKEYPRAAVYMEQAASVRDAPPLVLRMKAGIFARAGDPREALGMWQEVHDDPRSDAPTRAVAERQVRELRIRIELQDLEAALASYRASRGHAPGTLQELVQAGLLVEVPLDPDGNPYVYDRERGSVTGPSGRVLGTP